VMRMAASVAAAALLPPPSGTPASYICCQVTAQDCFTSTFAEVAGKPQTPWQLLVLMKWSLPAAGSLCTHQHETRRVPGAGGIAQHCMMQWVSQQGTLQGQQGTGTGYRYSTRQQSYYAILEQLVNSKHIPLVNSLASSSCMNVLVVANRAPYSRSTAADSPSFCQCCCRLLCHCTVAVIEVA
jgi:hypothetical protein